MLEKITAFIRLFRTSLRLKLIVGLLAIVLVMGAIATYLGLTSINRNVIGAAYDNVRNSLAAINDIYREEIRRRSALVQYVAGLPEIQDATAERNRAYLFSKLEMVKKSFGFDIVNVVQTDGVILVRANNYDSWGDSVAGYKYIRWVMEHGLPASGTGVLGYDNILKESPELAARTRLPIVPTPRGRALAEKVEDHALVLKAVSPIMKNGRMVGILYAAILLNNNDEMVDHIKKLLFRDEKIKGRDVGAATIFLDGVRVATNVMDSKRRRVVGTVVSDDVYRRVFEGGKDWVGRAFVTDDWYISGYSRLTDLEGAPIGMLFVGMLENKYDIILRRTTIIYLLVILAVTALSLTMASRIINRLLGSLNRMVTATGQIAHGQYRPLPILTTDDREIRALSEDFNDMVKAVEERDLKLQDLADRTILRSEKLASIGRLASGIAHEINNPLTGVLSFSELLLEEFKGTEHEEDLKVIRDETLRCRKIVRGMLDFARDNKPERTVADLNFIVEDALRLLEKHESFQDIKIVKELDPKLPEVRVDQDEIRSVVNNLCVNAADAMPGGGRLTIATGYEPAARRVFLRVTDTGTGISEDNMKKIFEPFFTTKGTGRGTGLGLAMTYGVIKRHNGTIDVKSKLGEGTEFIIRLPLG